MPFAEQIAEPKLRSLYLAIRSAKSLHFLLLKSGLRSNFQHKGSAEG